MGSKGMKPIFKKVLETIVDICLDQKKKIATLERSNALLEKKNSLLVTLLHDIKAVVDSGDWEYVDRQQISVGIKRWIHELDRENLLESNIKPGLVRE